MRPPACVRNKWGSGTTCERPPPVAKELQSNFEKMMAERVKQDANWFVTKDVQTKSQSSPSNDLGTTKK
jgi:hypothetical protein